MLPYTTDALSTQEKIFTKRSKFVERKQLLYQIKYLLYRLFTHVIVFVYYYIIIARNRKASKPEIYLLCCDSRYLPDPLAVFQPNVYSSNVTSSTLF